MKKLVLPGRGAEILFDARDENVRLLEKLFQVQIHARGAQVSVEGTEEGTRSVERILSEFSELIRGGVAFSNGDLKDAFQQIAQSSAESLHDVLPRTFVVKTPSRQVAPRSPNQAKYLDAIERNDLIIAVGPAGTGKTYLAVAMAVSLLMKKAVRRIILARPAVEAGEKLGFLPGDMQEKVNPYLRPLYDSLYNLIDGEKVQKLLEQGVIEVAPIAFMRGRTLSDSFIILDEAQNSTREQMKMFLTRLGLHSKTVVTGDITQIDLPKGQQSGLIHACEILKSVEGIAFCSFDSRDVVRHRLVQLIIDAYERSED
ncbi:MAG TPA: PhoH family protein [Acidobacteriota bacterium]|nr:PhoH family protein [Acidobacteriota bacterium]